MEIKILLPKIDLRLIPLGECKHLIPYAEAVGGFLREYEVAQLDKARKECVKDNLDINQWHGPVHHAQIQIDQFRTMLAAQVVMQAWASLEGGLNLTADFLSSEKKLPYRIGESSTWHAIDLGEPRPKDKVEFFRRYFDRVLSYPLPFSDGDVLRMAQLYKLRNNVGHQLLFDDESEDVRAEALAGHLEGCASGDEGSGEETALSGEAPGIVYARFAAALITTLRAKIESDFPIGAGVTIWSRKFQKKQDKARRQNK